MHPKSLDDNIIFLCGRIAHIVSSRVTQVFRERGFKITVEQFTLLTVLWYNDGIPQKEIANRLDRDKTSITRIIDNMVKENLVVRIPSEKDKRINLIYLTHKGKSLQNEPVAASGEVFFKAIDGLNENDIHTSNRALNQIIRNLS